MLTKEGPPSMAPRGALPREPLKELSPLREAIELRNLPVDGRERRGKKRGRGEALGYGQARTRASASASTANGVDATAQARLDEILIKSPGQDAPTPLRSLFGDPAFSNCEISSPQVSFIDKDLLGRGRSKEVFKGTLQSPKRSHSKEVAVAKLNEVSHSELDEFKRLSGLKHPNVVAVLGIVASKQGRGTLIISDLYDGDLWDALRLTRYSKEESIEIMLEIARGLAFLHRDQGLVHGDIKSGNVLILGRTRAAICDLGHTISVAEAQSGDCEYAGTLGYRPPEVLVTSGATARFGPPADIYALALTFWEICQAQIKPRNPFTEGQEDAASSSGWRPCTRYFRSDWKEITRLIRQMWSHDPAERPNIEDVLRELETIKTTVGQRGGGPEGTGRVRMTRSGSILGLDKPMEPLSFGKRIRGDEAPSGGRRTKHGRV